MSEEPKKKTVSGSGSLQRDEEKTVLRKNIKAIREGHLTGGYCDSEELQAEEKRLSKLLREDLEAARKEHGHTQDPKFKHADVRRIELELNGLSWKPTLVAKED